MFAIPVMCSVIFFASDDFRPTTTSSTETEAHQKLLAWQQAARGDRIECEFTRYVYDDTWDVVKVGRGRIIADREIGSQIELTGSDHIPARLPRDTAGNKYRVVSDESQTWIWTDEWVLAINPDEQTATRIEFGASQPMSNAKARTWFLASLLKANRSVFELMRNGILADQNLISQFLDQRVIPHRRLSEVDFFRAKTSSSFALNFYSVEVAFTDHQELPCSMLFIDPGETHQTVYVFKNIRRGRSDCDTNPANFDLSEYNVQKL